jgi:cytochrome c-type biogenesis protein CcmH/NrfG
MYFLGMAAAEAGETDAAAAHWGKLLTRLDPGTQAHAEVKARLDGLARGVAPRP